MLKVSKNDCSGCGACAQICTRNAINMVDDKEGFLYPIIDQNKCIKCGLCNTICPITSTTTENSGDTQHCYVATTENSHYYMDSASIGICTMLSKYILSKNGCVFGVFLDESDWTAYHIAVDKEDGLNTIRNSKYLQSNTKDTFSQVKKKLKDGRDVLYIGTPCQIAGLKSFLRHPYDSLYTIDLICHGVFSPRLMPYEVKYWENKFGGKLMNFRFRSKRVYQSNGGMVNFDIEKNGKKEHIERFAGGSPTYRCFAYSGDGINYNLRPSCYSCHFRSVKRYGDITVGDPWFINDKTIKNPNLTSRNFIRSLYSVNTEKGVELAANIKDFLIEEELKLTDAFCQPALKNGNRQIPEKRLQLFANLATEEYGSLVERLLDCDLEKAHQVFNRKYRISRIKKAIKSLLVWK